MCKYSRQEDWAAKHWQNQTRQILVHQAEHKTGQQTRGAHFNKDCLAFLAQGVRATLCINYKAFLVKGQKEKKEILHGWINRHGMMAGIEFSLLDCSETVQNECVLPCVVHCSLLSCSWV